MRKRRVKRVVMRIEASISRVDVSYEGSEWLEKKGREGKGRENVTYVLIEDREASWLPIRLVGLPCL